MLITAFILRKNKWQLRDFIFNAVNFLAIVSFNDYSNSQKVGNIPVAIEISAFIARPLHSMASLKLLTIDWLLFVISSCHEMNMTHTEHLNLKRHGYRSKTTASSILKGKFDVVTQVKLTIDAEDDARKTKKGASSPPTYNRQKSWLNLMALGVNLFDLQLII